MMPAAFGCAGGRMIAGKFTGVPHGSFLLVLSDGKRIGCLEILDQPDLVENMIGLAGEARAFVAGRDGLSIHSACVSAIGIYLDSFGTQPGVDPPPVPDQGTNNLLGLLLAALPDDAVRSVFGRAQ